MKKLRICITGGHLTPALAVIEEIHKTHPDWTMMVIGRRQVFEGEDVVSQEERLVRAAGVPFYGLTTGRLGRDWSLLSFLSLVKIPAGFAAALRILIGDRPNLILSFGGYIAFPVVLVGAILNIPVITHEQTSELGFANRIIARLAKRVLLAHDIGIPLRRALFLTSHSSKPSFIRETRLPIVYITGGSTGAQSLNALIYPLLPALCTSFLIIHQTGERNSEEARQVRDALGSEIRNNYVALGYMDVRELSWVYRHASLVIGRSGANTTAEVSALGVPALFLPLPWSAGGEQQKNAHVLADQGMAVVLDQQTLSGDLLLKHITAMMHDIKRFQQAAAIVSAHYPRGAASIVVTTIEDNLVNTHLS